MKHLDSNQKKEQHEKNHNHKAFFPLFVKWFFEEKPKKKTPKAKKTKKSKKAPKKAKKPKKTKTIKIKL